MGKNKTSSKPSAKQEPPPAPEVGKKKAKGHRQRGAGTVIVAKAPRETDDGIVLRAHERLPSTLLREYCQKEKRPLPSFARKRADDDSSWRFGVSLPDKKNSKDDLWFLPVQSFPSDKVAKDFAALLALFHFQGNLPLERKLPEPYATTWKGMLSSKSSSSSVVSASSVVASSSCSPAPLKSGGSDKTKAGGTYMNNRTPSAPPSSSASKVAEVVTSSSKVPPQAVVDLRSANQHVSKGLTERERNERQAARSKKNAYFDALRKANRPTAVLLSMRMRRLLEVALKIEASVSLDTEDEADVEGQLRTILSDVRDEEGGMFLPATQLTPVMQAETVRSVCQELRRDGFPGSSILGAISFVCDDTGAVEGVSAVMAQPSGSDSSSSVSTRFARALRERCLQRLLLVLPESAIPSGFDEASRDGQSSISLGRPRRLTPSTTGMISGGDGGGEGTRARRVDDEENPSGGSVASEEESKWAQLELGKTNKVDQRVADTCLGYGFTKREALLAARLVSSSFSSSSMSDSALRHATLTLLLSTVHAAPGQSRTDAESYLCCENAKEKVVMTSPRTEEAVREEAELLSAIFPEALAVVKHPDGDAISLSLRLETDRLTWPDAWPVKPKLAKYRLDVSYLLQSERTCGGMLAMPLVHAMGKSVDTHALQRLQVSLMRYARGVWERQLEESEEDVSGGTFELLSALEDGTVHALPSSTSPSSPQSVTTTLYQWSTGHVGTQKGEGARSGAPALHEDVPVPLPLKQQQQQQQQQRQVVDISPLSVPVSAATDATSTDSRRRGDRVPRPGFWSTKAATSARPLKVDPSITRVRAALPAAGSRDAFATLLRGDERHLVVTGETGCGKTTQIPQFIAEMRAEAKVVVCQPRRLAAVGVASRVADEVGCALGDTVGYMVRGESKVSSATRLLFCTYGVLLRRLQEDPELGAVTHVILDEVHERGIESDFALALLSAATRRRSTLSIVVMSATIATGKFSEYLGGATGLGRNAPVLEIPGRTYPVTAFYKDQYQDTVLAAVENAAAAAAAAAAATADPCHDDDDDDDYHDASGRASRIAGVPASDRIDYFLIMALLSALASGSQAQAGAGSGERGGESGVGMMLARAEGAVLVFLPGVPEIERLARLLASSSSHLPRVVVQMLHGGLSAADQKRVFAPLAGSDRGREQPLKVVLSTNVAEASVTIPDVTVVIDTCRVKENTFDSDKGMSSLVTRFAAQDALRQRMGRAGRVCAGRCFRLVTHGTYTKLPTDGTPEMKRVPLDRLVLQCSDMLSHMPAGVTDLSHDAAPLDVCAHMLDACPDPPSRAAVRDAHHSLLTCRALDAEGHITPLGRHLAALPCAPRIGRILIYGALLGCARDCAAIAAALITRSPLLTPREPDARRQADVARARLAARYGKHASTSDHVVLAAAAAAYHEAKGMSARRAFCKAHFLSMERMTEVCHLQEDLLAGLSQLGFKPTPSPPQQHPHKEPTQQMKDPPLVCAARDGDVAKVRSLVTAGAHVNAPGARGLTPLMWAVRRGHEELAVALVEMGANVNIKCGIGSTALDYNMVMELRDVLKSRGMKAVLHLAAPAPVSARDRTSSTTTHLPLSLDETKNSNTRLLLGAVCAGLYPQLVRVLKPPKRFIATHSGAIERDAEAREVKYYISDGPSSSSSSSSSSLHHASAAGEQTALSGIDAVRAERDAHINIKGLRRIFVHPSSINFSQGSYESFYLAYGELRADASGSKTYVQDSTEAAALPILLFGGRLTPNFSEGTVTVGGRVTFRAPSRVVALLERLREALDGLLDAKFADPSLDLSSCDELAVARMLIACDGI